MAKIKYFSLHADAYDVNGEKHIVTVVGKFTQNYKPQTITQDVPVEVKPGSFVNGKLTFNKRILHRKLTLGISICHPSDKFDEELGIEIAKSRIEKGKDAGSIETNDVTMITEDLIIAEILGKLSYVCANIDKYIS